MSYHHVSFVYFCIYICIYVSIGPDSYMNHLHMLVMSIYLVPQLGGLQSLIDICLAYSKKWLFNFGIAKSKCMISGANLFCCQPSWHLGSQRMHNSSELDVLCIIFFNDGNSEKHVHKRIQKCGQAFYSMSSSGMSYSGLPTDIKSHLWKTFCSVTHFCSAWKLFLCQ